MVAVGQLLRSRLLAAMGVSLLLHGLILFAFAPSTPDPGLQGLAPTRVSLMLRLQQVTHRPSPAFPPLAPRSPAPAPKKNAPASAAFAPPVESLQPVSLPLDMPVLEDPTVYEVRDLDSFPQPLEPLMREPWLDSVPPSRSLSMELAIDAQGVVQEASLVGEIFEGAEDVVAQFKAVRFAPAVRDGRGVHSRITMRLDSGG